MKVEQIEYRISVYFHFMYKSKKIRKTWHTFYNSESTIDSQIDNLSLPWDNKINS